jgi:hypothetical protein
MKIKISVKCTMCGSETEIKLKQDEEYNDISISDNFNGSFNNQISPNNSFKIKQTCPDEIILICRDCGNQIALTT